MKNKLYIFLILVVSLFTILSFSSFAADEPSVSDSPAVPTDLTGYTVYVPEGWTASSGYGKFQISRTDFYVDGVLNTSDLSSIIFWVGYGSGFDFTFPSMSNHIVFSTFPLVLDHSHSFSFTVTGGQDVTNENLIQWLVDNNAVFEAPPPPPPPPTVLDSILSLFLAVSTWLGQAVGVIISMFWTGSELTFVGVLSVAGLAFSVSFLIIALISRFIRFGG